MKRFLILLGLLPLASFAQRKPNIVLINADDLGFGDIGCNEFGVVPTPNVDKIASQGVRITNAHATSATSTPSRFSLLTGSYAWRTPGTGVATGDAGMIVKPDIKTMPDMLKRAGYTTAAVGKWHLGIGDKTGTQNWNQKISPALDSIGFDYSFIMAATADRVPCVYIEQGEVVGLDPNDPIEISYSKPFDGLPLGKTNPELLRLHPSHGHDQAIIDSISRIGYMKGGKSALWKDELIADRITDKALDFIRSNADTTFFLYFATNDVHVPRVPHWKFKGKSGLGDRGDAILQFDYCVGRVAELLDSLGIADNTLIIITSDNGSVLDDGYIDKAKELNGNHRPWGNFRGGKYSAFEAGTRVPFIVKWKNGIKTNQVSNALISQVDIFASLANLVGANLAKDEANDSQNMINAMMGKDKIGRKWLVEDAYTRAIVVGDWKYIKPSNRFKIAWETGNETGNDMAEQLYNLKNDASEKNNLAVKYPKKVMELAELLKEIENNENN